VSAQPYAPTHVVPAGGLPAYERADPSAPVVARLDPQLEVQLAERLGDWARIVCSNGWGAWVDGRYLLLRGSQPVAAPPPTTAATPRSIGGTGVKLDVALAGVALIVVGALMPWVRGEGLDGGNASKVPLSALWSAPESTTDGPVKLWLVLAALALIGAIGVLRPAANAGLLRRIGGFGSAACGALFIVWLYRLTSVEGIEIGLTDVVGIGPIIVVGGGLLLALRKVPT
jgi:hypothetical protein